MTQLYVPPLRARFVLLEDWTFPLHHEYRNTTFGNFMKVEYKKDKRGYIPYGVDPVEVTIPKGTVMYIDRYYIKNGSVNYDSITFRSVFGKKTHRFWAKLADANRIQADFSIE